MPVLEVRATDQKLEIDEPRLSLHLQREGHDDEGPAVLRRTRSGVEGECSGEITVAYDDPLARWVRASNLVGQLADCTLGEVRA